MYISKKESRIFSELLHGVLFMAYWIILLKDESHQLLSNRNLFFGAAMTLTVSTVVLFIISTLLIEIVYKTENQLLEDERDLIADSKIHKYSNLIYEFGFVFLLGYIWFHFHGQLSINSTVISELIFDLLIALLILKIIKSTAQLILYRTH